MFKRAGEWFSEHPILGTIAGLTVLDAMDRIFFGRGLIRSTHKITVMPGSTASETISEGSSLQACAPAAAAGVQAMTVSATSSNPAVASVTAPLTGTAACATVQGMASGTATITVSFSDTSQPDAHITLTVS